METSQTADYALRVLLELGEHDGQTVAQLSKALDVSRSVGQRIVATLHGRAFIVRSPGGRFRLGPKLLQVSRNIPHELEYSSGGFLRELTTLTGETVILASAVGPDTVVVSSRSGTNGPLHIDVPPGLRVPLQKDAAGMVLLAHSPYSSAQEALPSQIKTLEDVKLAGFAFSTGGYGPGTVTLASPVIAAERVAGSIAIVAPDCRADAVLSHKGILLETSSKVAASILASQAAQPEIGQGDG
ncbi:IclR family transcriptional regulator [Paenarthrobacter nitroguajacolicus]|uniref:IclR family transcriptional regulator n=1 Tax=Paenarthrobacter nitroguajacolicus TaxID=211146 RepID=UPI000AFC5008|nr:MarR family transcriptional regulator [Paenarthrobacter nitroguajacolicus]